MKKNKIGPSDHEKRKLVKAITNKKLNLAKCAEIVHISRKMLSDIRGERRGFDAEKMKMVTKILNRVKKDLFKINILLVEAKEQESEYRAKKILKLLRNRYFFVELVFGKEISQKITRFRNKKRIDFPFEDSQYMVECLVKFQTELS